MIEGSSINGRSHRKRAKDMRRPVVPIDLKSVGPAMRALPNDMWRAAATARFLVPPGRGANSAAARAAGFGQKPKNIKCIAYQIFHDPRMQAALHELGEAHLKAGVPDALMIVDEILTDKAAPPRDRLRAAQIYIDREHRIETTHHVVVENRFDSKDLAEKLQRIALRFNLDPGKVLAKSQLIDGEFRVEE